MLDNGEVLHLPLKSAPASALIYESGLNSKPLTPMNESLNWFEVLLNLKN